MRIEKNKFGEGVLYDGYDLMPTIYTVCTACMSIYSEFLSWANYRKEWFVKSPEDANIIIVLSCQVTDLAVLNDLRTLEKLMQQYPKADFFVGGCLARRFDIQLPKSVKRLNNVCSDYHEIEEIWMVNYKAPFWVKNFNKNGTELEDGHLFRNSYPLRIGVGCNGKCQYCTIRHTRGPARQLEPNITEFLEHEDKDIVLIADNPSVDQIAEWCTIAEVYNQPISLRNVEPTIAIILHLKLLLLAENGLLKRFHCPIQHTNIEALIDMHRNLTMTTMAIQLAMDLKKQGVITATNIIIDYKHFPNPENLNYAFDYISWNPYWDGKWNREKAEQRFLHYF